MTVWPFSRLSTHSPNRRILRAALIVGTLSVLARGVAMVKELLVARTFGRADAVDAFLIAYLPASFIQYLFAGAVAITLVPAYVRLRQHVGLEAASRLASTLALIAVALAGAAALLLAITTAWWLPWIGSGFTPEKLALTRNFVWVVLPVAVFSGYAMCVTGLLNASESFGAPALVPIITPLFTMALIATGATRWGGYTLAAGMSAGGLIEALVLVALMHRRGLHLPIRWYGIDSEVRQALGDSARMSISYAFSNTGSVDQAMAAMLPAGSVAALGYANRVPSTLALLGSSSVASAALPYLSELVAARDVDGCAHVLKRWTWLVLAAGVPLAIGLMLGSQRIISVLFERGAFTAADSELVGRIQMGAAWVVPFFACSSLFMRFLSSMRRADLVLRVSLFTLVLNVVLNLAFMHVWGVVGIAISTSVVSLLTFIAAAAVSSRVLARAKSAVTA